jgi:hypothetical protein
MTADRSTENGWIRKLEEAADSHEPGSTHRAFTFRQILHAAWADGWERGNDDSRDDAFNAERAARKAAKETQP